MGRRDDDELIGDEEVVAAELATRRLLQRYDQPKLVQPPPGLAPQIMAGLPGGPRRRSQGLPRLLGAGLGLGLATSFALLVTIGLGELASGAPPGGLTADLRGSLSEAVRPLATRVLPGLRLPLLAPLGLPLVATVILAALGGGAAAVWPRRLTGVGRTLLARPGRSLALGLLVGLALAALGAGITAALAFTVVGLPLLPLALMLLQVPYILGAAALGLEAGHHLGLRPAPLAAAAGVLVLAVPTLLLWLASPSLGLGLFYFGAGLGVGALILSRGGAFPPE